jgi:hypothetical protein
MLDGLSPEDFGIPEQNPVFNIKKQIDETSLSPAAQTVKILKLVSGETLISTVLEETPTSYKVSAPVSMTFGVDNKGNSHANFVQWMNFSQEDVCELNKEKVIAAAVPTPEALNIYSEAKRAIAEGRVVVQNETENTDGGTEEKLFLHREDKSDKHKHRDSEIPSWHHKKRW